MYYKSESFKIKEKNFQCMSREEFSKVNYICGKMNPRNYK